MRTLTRVSAFSIAALVAISFLCEVSQAQILRGRRSTRCQPAPTANCCPSSATAGCASYGCYFSCPSGWTPIGSCCRTWYYDEHGNRVCTSYGTRCSPPINSGSCSTGCNPCCTYGRNKKCCTPWFNFCDDPMNPWCRNKYRDCRMCNRICGYDCGGSFREYDPDPPRG